MRSITAYFDMLFGFFLIGQHSISMMKTIIFAPEAYEFFS
jgi:hypothetical protein